MPQLILTLILCLTTLPTLAQQPPAANAPTKPNILLIVADDLGYADLSIHGGTDIPTPHIDSIAKSGTRFTSGYVTCPVCSPTRAGLLTGRYQQRFGHEFNPGPQAAANFGLPLTETTLPQVLKANGYKTGMVGKWHLGNRDGFQPHQRGFDEFYGFLAGARAYLPAAGPATRPAAPILRNGDKIDEKDYLTDAFAREAVAFIDRHKKEPFFLYLPFNAVHTPMHATEKYLSRFPKLEGKRKTYAAMLSAMDDAVGATLKKLRDEKLEDNTLIFFISDNGGPPGNSSTNTPLNGRKGTVYEGGIRVPFFVQWKAKLPQGVVKDHPVAAIDIFPTALAAAATPEGKKLDGVNLLPLLTGQSTAAPHDRLFWRFGPQWAIREGNWKLMKPAGANTKPALFDLADDLGEKTDLAAANPDTVKRLTDAYAKWNAENADPLWKRQQGPRRQRQNQAHHLRNFGPSAVTLNSYSRRPANTLQFAGRSQFPARAAKGSSQQQRRREKLAKTANPAAAVLSLLCRTPETQASAIGRTPNRPRVSQEPSGMQMSAAKPLRILLVEDHEDTKIFMSRLLRTFKHDVKTAGTVQDALALADGNNFDLVISDLGLPDGDGFALMLELREKYGLKGIALSGYGEDMTRGQEVGFMAHLTKPISFDQLQELIGKVAS